MTESEHKEASALAAAIRDICRNRKAYRAPAESLSGVQTLVHPRSTTDEGKDTTPSQAAPRTDKPLSSDVVELYPLHLNVPSGTGGGNEGISKTRTRNRPKPGDETGSITQGDVPYKSTPLLTRRTMEGMLRQVWDGHKS